MLDILAGATPVILGMTRSRDGILGNLDGTYRSLGLRPPILCNQVACMEEILRRMKLFPPRVRSNQSTAELLLS